MFEKLKQKLKQVKERITKKVAPEPISEETQEAVVETKPEVLPGESEAVRPDVLPKAQVVEPESLSEVPVEVKPKVSVETKPEIFPEAPRKVPKIKREVPGHRVEPERPKEAPTKVISPEKPKRGFIRAVKRVAGRELTPKDIDDIVWDLQVAMLESDVAVSVADQIVERVKEELVGKKIGMRTDVKKMGDEVLRDAIKEALTSEHEVDLLKIINDKRTKGEPAVLVFVGINGHGKTTTIAKFSRYLTKRGYKVVLAAGDTFRAAAIEQLEIHAERLGVDIIKQKRGSDSAAVAHDAISHAKARGINVVLVDTAGRMQTDVNLMDEMKKVIRVSKPDAVIFVGDALTGNDAVEQARTFDQAVGITGSILCKMDADARGGAALSITQVTGKPILFLGTGQEYDDLVEFKPDIILNALFGD
ncbi:MAG: signal recognition particle-docking protein FtsY [Methanobacteriota archaeon]